MRGTLVPILLFLVPVAVGTVPEEMLVAYLAGAALVIALRWLAWRAGHPGAAKRLLLPGAFCVTLAIADLLARVLLTSALYFRPDEMFLSKYPRMPLVSRFAPNTRYAGRTHGDLAAIGGLPHREPREIRFATDAAGFPNEPDAAARTIDLILLGDSYGVGSGTSQELTWGRLFGSRYGFHVYNLSISSASPWHEYIALATELDRLRVTDGALVVWAIFTGNDLDEFYYPSLEPRDLPWMDPIGALGVSLRTFQNRSPIRQIVTRFTQGRRERDQVIERRFVDGSTVLFYSPYARRRGRSLEDVRRHEHYPNLEATLGAMARLARARGLHVAVVVVPSKEEVYSWVLDGGRRWSAGTAPSGLAQALEAMAGSYGFMFVDLKPRLIEASERVFRQSGALLWWRDDTHWNERGHAAAAAIVSEHVARRRDPR